MLSKSIHAHSQLHSTAIRSLFGRRSHYKRVSKSIRSRRTPRLTEAVQAPSTTVCFWEGTSTQAAHLNTPRNAKPHQGDIEQQQPKVNGRARYAELQHAPAEPYDQAPRRVYIPHEWKIAARAARHGSTAMAMRRYFQIIDGHFLVTDSFLDFTHVSSALYGTAQIWLAAQADPQTPHRPQLYPELQDFLRRMLVRLQLVQSKLNSRAVSSILWSFAKLGQHPDTLMPGIVDGIAQRYIQDIDTATGQSHSSVMQACDQLRLDPCQGTMLKAILQHLDSVRLAQYNAHDLASITHGLAKLPQAQPTTQLLDKLCDCFLRLFQSRSQAQRPNSQGVATFAWALQELNHSPSPALASAMIQRMLQLCQRSQKAPKAQEISNLILACSQLQMPITQGQAQLLVLCLLSHRRLKPQDITNTAWALAMMGILRQDTFTQLLRRFAAVFTRATPERKSALRQMYQAMHSLQPPSDANPQQYKAWVDTRWQLQYLGPMPEPDLKGRTQTHKPT